MNPTNNHYIAKYKPNKLQKSGNGGRIQLPEPLLETLGLKYGQELEIEADLSEGTIILKPKKSQAQKKDTAKVE